MRDPAFIPGARVVERTFAELTTLRIGGAPAAVVACSEPSSLASVVSLLDANSIPLLVLGGGSNLVIGEGDEVSELVVVWAVDSASEISIDAETGVVRAFAGVNFDQLVAATVEAGLSGLECLSGIPGSVGATPVQNVGAYGAEVSQVLRRVQLFERGAVGAGAGDAGSGAAADLQWVSPESLDLSYRYSNLKFTQRAVVTAVEFQLGTDGLSVPLRFGELARKLGVAEEDARAGNADARRPVAQVREAVLELRAGKGMVLNPDDHDTWSAGSFFTNPIVEGEEVRNAVIAAVREKCGEEKANSIPVFSAGRGGAAEDDAVKNRAAENPAVKSANVDSEPANAGVERFKFSAAWLIDNAGFSKGYAVPGHESAALSSKHTLALTNRGSATSADIIALARSVRNGVHDAFGVTLEPEPVWIGARLD
ncbi:UDP-N-acetylmuramate dehydrogenase [Corynebacterium suicordis]|uniref:UDP-N-acetylmuramate dehydrogenase n=1 Tax=uncultured Corynebacterium sp. TaxID=159447 RepID=UPI001E322138|nr:UDP-N-acetylmuramate dehydrogenase [Corynebacterium suicordis]